MNNEKIRVYFDSVKYREKPSDMPRISNNITKNLQELSITEIALKLASGQTILPAEMSGKRSKANFKQTSLILLDFDNNSDNYLSIEDVLNKPFVKKFASFLYETFSSTETKNKFRLAFVLDKPITNNAHYEYMYEYLLEKFPEADSACKDSSRVFFGGKNPILINKNNKLKVLTPPKTHLKARREVLEPTGLIVQPDNYKADRGVISLFRSNNIEDLKRHIQDNELALNLTVSSVTEGLQELYKIDMYKLLGLEYVSPFQCIISEDNNPSASIFKNAKGVFIYNRFSEDENKQFTLNIRQLLEKLTGKSSSEVNDLLFKLFNIRVKYSKEIINSEFKIMKFISDLSEENLKILYPNTHKVLGRDIYLIKDLLNHFIKNKFEYVKGDKIIVDFISQMGVRTIAKDLFDYIGDYRLEKTKKRISTLTYIGLISKLEDDEIPENILENILNYKFQNRHKNRKNILKLEIDNLNLDFLEIKCKELLDMGYRATNFKSDFLAINGDLNDKDRVFPNSKDKKITEKISGFLDEIVNFINDKFNSNNLYILEKELKDYLLINYSKSFILDNYSICINSALTLTNCEKIRANTENKEIFKIKDLSAKQVPLIIVKKCFV